MFNESKLLKCIGQLCLKIHDRQTPVKMDFYHDEGDSEGFEIGLIETGELAIVNLRIYVKKISLLFKSQYNSKSPYPLLVEHKNCDYPVFDDQGEWDQEFIDFCNTL